MSRSDIAGSVQPLPRTAPHKLPAKAVYGAGGAVALYVVLLLMCEVGTVDGDRIHNPAPPPPTRAQTFLGIRDTSWFPVMYCVSAVVLGAILWWLARRWRATGQAHPAVAVLLAFVLLSLVDPLISWGSYTAYNPDLIHFPLDWRWWDLAPVVQTSWVTGAYSLFYMVPTLAGVWFWRTLAGRVGGPGSFVRTHPLAASWLFGTAFGFVYDLPSESLLINMNIWHYWQWWGPTVSIGTATVPLTEALWTGLLVGTAVAACQPDDRGHSRLAVTLAGRPLARRLRLGETGVVIVLLAIVYAGYLATFTAIRITGLSHHVEKEWPFATAKVYDPYGDAKAAGVPGPYYPGVGAWTVR